MVIDIAPFPVCELQRLWGAMWRESAKVSSWLLAPKISHQRAPARKLGHRPSQCIGAPEGKTALGDQKSCCHHLHDLQLAGAAAGIRWRCGLLTWTRVLPLPLSARGHSLWRGLGVGRGSRLPGNCASQAPVSRGFVGG